MRARSYRGSAPWAARGWVSLAPWLAGLFDRQPATDKGEEADGAAVMGGKRRSANLRQILVGLDEVDEARCEKWRGRMPCRYDGFGRMEAVIDHDVELLAVEQMLQAVATRDELIIFVQLGFVLSECPAFH